VRQRTVSAGCVAGAYVRWHTDKRAGVRCNAITNVAQGFRRGVRTQNFFQLFTQRQFMNSIVYLVGAVVIIIAVLSFFGLR